MQMISPITNVVLDSMNYLKHRDILIKLYSLSFTEGKDAQHISNKEIEKSLDDTMAVGFGLMSFQKEKLLGAVLCLSLNNDSDFPFDAHNNIDPSKTIYIADLMVNPNYRGQRVAQGLLEHLFQSTEVKSYHDAVIRVWNKNMPAVLLYKKLGFKEIDTIFQTKLKKETKEPFEMRKIYMHLELRIKN